MFLEWWNTTKSLSNIWQHLSCPFDKGTAKICKKFNSHRGFLRADQDRAKNCCQIWLDWLSYLGFAYFCNPLIKYTWKTLEETYHKVLNWFWWQEEILKFNEKLFKFCFLMLYWLKFSFIQSNYLLLTHWNSFILHSAWS